VRTIGKTLLLAGLFAAARPSASFAQLTDATAVVSAAREALGGDKNLTAVHSFVATGRTRQLRGNNLVPIEFEMSCEWPDRYVRRDEIPAQDTGLTVSGFSGVALIRGPVGAAGRGDGRGAGPGGSGGAPGGGGPPPPEAQVAALKADFARMLLGIMAGSLPSYPLTFTYVAVAEAPEGKADVIEAAGPDGFSARLLVQQTTHLPVMVTWRAQPNVESRLYFADYRDVNGVKWPFRIRRAVGANTIEETTFDRIRTNVRIDPKKFEVPK